MTTWKLVYMEVISCFVFTWLHLKYKCTNHKRQKKNSLAQYNYTYNYRCTTKTALRKDIHMYIYSSSSRLAGNSQ